MYCESIKCIRIQQTLLGAIALICHQIDLFNTHLVSLSRPNLKFIHCGTKAYCFEKYIPT